MPVRPPRDTSFRHVTVHPANGGEPDVIGTFFAHRDASDWFLTGRVGIRNQALVLIDFEFQPEPEFVPLANVASSTTVKASPIVQRGLSASEAAALVRSVNFSDLLRRFRDEFRHHFPRHLAEMEAEGYVIPQELANQVRAAADAVAAVDLAKGRKGYPDDFYRRIALRYLDLCDSGKGRGALGQIAAEEGKHQGRAVPRDTVKSWLRKARQLQFLIFEGRGVAGAVAGPNLFPAIPPTGSTKPAKRSARKPARAKRKGD